jgi:hypothetical protein
MAVVARPGGAIAFPSASCMLAMSPSAMASGMTDDCEVRADGHPSRAVGRRAAGGSQDARKFASDDPAAQGIVRVGMRFRMSLGPGGPG